MMSSEGQHTRHVYAGLSWQPGLVGAWIGGCLTCGPARQHVIIGAVHLCIMVLVCLLQLQGLPGLLRRLMEQDSHLLQQPSAAAVA